MTGPPILPHVDAALNAGSAVLLCAGLAAIRRKRVEVHRACMLAAFACSTVFLACYLYYHAHAGSVRFPGTGAARAVYLSILASHAVLAAVVLPLVLRTLRLAARGDFERHRRVARWTWPVWMYVSVTGVVVYWMLYRVTW